MTEDTTPTTAPLGSLWDVKAKNAVKVTRPDGTEVTVLSDGKTAGHVLDLAGEYAATNSDGVRQSVTAG